MVDDAEARHEVRQLMRRFEFEQALEKRFDAEMKDRNKSDAEGEPGIGNRG